MKTRVLLNVAFTCMAVFCLNISEAQKTDVRVVYYDNRGTPIKIEEKISEGNTLFYVVHINNKSHCIKIDTIKTGDTMIVKESYYEIYRKTTTIERLGEAEILVYASNNAQDTITVSGYYYDCNGDNVFLADTVLTGENTKNYWNFDKSSKALLVPAILQGEIKVSLDSLILLESIVVYYLRGLPVKLEVYNKYNEQYFTASGKLTGNKLVTEGKNNNGDSSTSRLDKISWNSDTSMMQWYLRTTWSGETIFSKKLTDSTTVKVIYPDGETEVSKYMSPVDFLQVALAEGLIYYDVLLTIDLREFERRRLKELFVEDRKYRYEYKFDSENRISNIEYFYQDELYRSAFYYYSSN